MKEDSTNVELKPITIVGGELLTDPTNEKTTIPPEGQLNIDSPEKEEVVTIALRGKWPPKANEGKEEGKEEGR